MSKLLVSGVPRGLIQLDVRKCRACMYGYISIGRDNRYEQAACQRSAA